MSAEQSWSHVRLGDHATIKARLGWKGLKAHEYRDGGSIFLATPNIKDFEIDFRNVNHISEQRFTESAEIMLQVGDVLLVKDGSTLGISNLVRWLPAPTTINGSIALLRCRGDLHPAFLHQLTKAAAFQKLIQDKKSGLGVPHLFQADLREFVIPLPPLSEQYRIVEILETLDETIRKTEQVIAKLQQMKQGLLHDLLTRGIDDNGELRDPEQNPGNFTDSHLGQIPSAWEVATFGDCLISSPQNGLYKPSHHYGESGTPIVRIDGFYDGVMAPVSSLKRLGLTSAELDSFRLEQGDILINRVNSIDFVGKAGLVPILSEPVVFESNIMRCRLSTDRLTPGFAIRWIIAPYSRKWFHRRAKSAIAQASVNQTDVIELAIALPPLDEQQRIVERAEQAENRIDLEQRHLAKLRTLKHGLMDDLLTGRVRVTPDEAQ